jgi:hypothetical protein
MEVLREQGARKATLLHTAMGGAAPSEGRFDPAPGYGPDGILRGLASPLLPDPLRGPSGHAPGSHSAPWHRRPRYEPSDP